MIRTKGYHSPVILITEHVAVIAKDSITLFCQLPAYFEDFTAGIRSRLFYTKLSGIDTLGYDLIGYIVLLIVLCFPTVSVLPYRKGKPIPAPN